MLSEKMKTNPIIKAEAILKEAFGIRASVWRGRHTLSTVSVSNELIVKAVCDPLNSLVNFRRIR